jgi:hypothetical protein
MTGDPAIRTMRAQASVNLVVRVLLRTTGLGRLLGSRLITVYAVGRKSGRTYAAPVSYLAQGNDLLIGTTFGRVHVDQDGNASDRDLHLAWLGGARVIKLTPR